MNVEITNCRDYVRMYRDLLTRSPNAELGVSFYNYILEKGEQFDALDVTNSAEYKERYGLKRKECYYNCQKIATITRTFRYFEGWGFGVIPVGHAFLVSRDNVVIDPTWSGLYGDHDYFGIEIPKELITITWAAEGQARELLWTYLADSVLGGNGES